MIRDPMAAVEFHVGDCRAVLATLPAASVQCCVTSPPYMGLRSYGTEPVEWSDGWRGELGLEPQPSQYIAHIVEVFEAVKRVLRPDGCLFINLGDSYNGSGKGGNDGETSILKKPPERQGNVSPTRVAGLKPKDLLLMPHRVALALQEAGWWVRSTIVWAKSNPLPESVTDRPTQAHEYVFMLTRSARYYYDKDAVRQKNEGDGRTRGPCGGKQAGENGNRLYSGRVWTDSPAGRNLRSVISLATEALPEQHFATMPRALVRPLILAGTSQHGACHACGAPWRRDKRHKPSYNSKYESASLPAVSPGVAGNVVREGSPEGGWHPPLVSGVRFSREEGQSDETDRSGQGAEETVSPRACRPDFGTQSSPSEDPGGESANAGAWPGLSKDGKGQECRSRAETHLVEDRKSANQDADPGQPPEGSSSSGPGHLHDRGLAADTGAAAAAVSVLRLSVQPDSPSDHRSCSSPDPRRSPQPGEHRRSMPPVQLSQVEQSAALEEFWTQTCTCPPADPVPCVCLDPFAGSGTTGAVAAELGRRAILIDAKEEYIAMAKERVRRFGRPRRKPPEEDRRQLTFAYWEETS